MVHGAVGDDEIGTFACVAASVGVFAGLDADGVVAYVEGGSGEQHVGACVNVDAVAVGGIMGIADDYIAYRNVLAPKGMDVPAGGVLEGAAFEQHPLAAAQRYHHRAQEALDLVLVEGRVGVIEGAGSLARLVVTLVGIPAAAVGRHVAAAGDYAFPLVVRHFAALDFAPAVPAAVDDAAAGDGNVGGAVGVDGGEAAADVEPFEVGVDNGVKVDVGVEH